MWYQALQLLFPISRSFEHIFVAWVGTPSWPYPVPLCLGWCSSLSFCSPSFCAKDKCHHHSNGTHPEQLPVQSDHSSLSWGLHGDEQGHALQMELLVRAHRWVRHESGAKTGLGYPYCDLNKLHLTTSPSVWICMAVQMSFVVHPTIHTSSLGMWCDCLPSHASKVFSRESHDLRRDHSHSSRSLLSCLWVSSPAVPWGTRIRLRSWWRGLVSPLREARLSPLRIKAPLGKQAPVLKPDRWDEFRQFLTEARWVLLTTL